MARAITPDGDRDKERNMRPVRSKYWPMLRGVLALLTVAVGAQANTAAAADTYPSRPIHIVVGFGAGGPTDIPARFIADKLGKALNKLSWLRTSRPPAAS
jgi:hypothetical protein